MLLMVAACSPPPGEKIAELELKDIDNNLTRTGDLYGDLATVIIFMSPECPLCIGYTKTINEMINKYREKKISFISVYTGTWYSEEEIQSFIKEYDLKSETLLDTKYKLARLTRAEITPQVSVLNHAGEIVYTGAIDDRAYAPGKKRQVISGNFLEDALNAIINGQEPKVKKTEAVGCLIEL
jgi:protein-disulfide isomerase